MFNDYVIVVGYFEGYPIEITVSAEDQKEMNKAGFSDSEIYDYFNTYEDWQKDC